MLTNITAHPKTTIVAALIALANVLANGRDWKTISIAAVTAILGALAKDPNATH